MYAIRSYYDAFVHYIAAKHFYRKGDTEEALYHLETALFLQTDFPDASILLCEIYMQEHKYDEVRKEIEKVLNKHRNEYILWYMLGRAYEDLGDSANAISSYAVITSYSIHYTKLYENRRFDCKS